MKYAIKLFQLCYSKTQQHYILQEEVNTSKKELGFLFSSLREFPQVFDLASKISQIPPVNPKIEIESRNSNNFSVLIAMMISLNIQTDKFVYRSVLNSSNLAPFPKKTEPHVNPFIHTDFVTFIQRRIYHFSVS